MLAAADDLELFKRAQLSKLDYFKSWNMPLGSLRGVLAIALLLILSGSLFWSYNTIQQVATIRSEASDLINNIHVSRTGNYMLISFRTKTPLRASLITDNLTTHKITVTPISNGLTRLHTISVTRPAGSDLVKYRIKLQDGAGHTIETRDVVVK
jgi:hypothetical protein